MTHQFTLSDGSVVTMMDYITRKDSREFELLAVDNSKFVDGVSYRDPASALKATEALTFALVKTIEKDGAVMSKSQDWIDSLRDEDYQKLQDYSIELLTATKKK